MHRRDVVARARGLGGGLPHDGVWDDEDTGERQAEADDGGDGEGAPGGEGGRRKIKTTSVFHGARVLQARSIRYFTRG